MLLAPSLSARDLRRMPPAERDAVLRSEAADAADEYEAGAPLRGFDADRLEARYLDGENKPLSARALRRLPSSLRELVLRREAAEAADDYGSAATLRGFDAERLEAGHLGEVQS